MKSEIRTRSIQLLKNGSPSHPATDLLVQWDAFLKDGLMDNIHFEVVGIDQTHFSSIVDAEDRSCLIAQTEERLEHAFKHQNVGVYPSNDQISVLWFPPYPIYLNRLTVEEKVRLEKAVAERLQILGLLTININLSELTDGSGFEELFYDQYFVPKHFNEMLGFKQTMVFEQPSVELEADNNLIFNFLQAYSADDLESVVQYQLQPPYSFKIDNHCKDDLTSSSNREYFMPTFKAYLELDEFSNLQNITELVSSKLEIVEVRELNGIACIECLSPEGPFAETLGHIVGNIHDILGPILMMTFRNLGFEKVQLQFLLSVWH